METIRAFIAVQIPDEVKSKFAEAQRKLMEAGADVRWVKPGNTHITLQFLGDAPVGKIEEIESALGRAATFHQAVDISVEGLGVFPNARRPRVVWIGVSEGADSLAAMQASVSEEMRRLGFEPDKKGFSAHITLGRVKSQKNVQKLASLLEAEKDFRAEEIHLIRSVLSSEGPTYSTLSSSELRKPAP